MVRNFDHDDRHDAKGAVVTFGHIVGIAVFAPVLLVVGLLLLLLWWSAVLSGVVTLALVVAATLLAWFVAIYLLPKKVKVWSDDDY